MPDIATIALYASPIASGLVGVTSALLTNHLAQRREDREALRSTIDQRRLSEVNIHTHESVEVTLPFSANEDQHAFIIFRMQLHNEGDGPVDVLATLVAAREISSFGVGAGRDIGWKDLKRHYWNSPKEPGDIAFVRGISTTKALNVSAQEFPRMEVNENIEIPRLDTLLHVSQLPPHGLFFTYRIFQVNRGYTLGEMHRKLGHPEDWQHSIDKRYRNYQSLARPNYYRWRMIQKALFNINRLSFRLATGMKDPLGFIADPNVWRLFLLHHWDFIDNEPGWPESLPKVYQPQMSNVSKQVENVISSDQYFKNKVVNTESLLRLQAPAAAYARDHLPHFVKAWERFFDLAHNRLDPSRGIRVEKDWYISLIHNNPEYRDRWLALLNEGYIVIPPLRRVFGGKKYSQRDIPDDPRILEPFVMRERFFLVPIVPGSHYPPFNERYPFPFSR